MLRDLYVNINYEISLIKYQYLKFVLENYQNTR